MSPRPRARTHRARSRGSCRPRITETEILTNAAFRPPRRSSPFVLTCLAGLLVALPNFFSKETVASWPSFMPKQQLPLGLDLQGGAHLLLDMDQDEIKKDWLNNLRDESRKPLRGAKIGCHRYRRAGDAARQSSSPSPRSARVR